jgi:hypothetical protein
MPCGTAGGLTTRIAGRIVVRGERRERVAQELAEAAIDDMGEEEGGLL